MIFSQKAPKLWFFRKLFQNPLMISQNMAFLLISGYKIYPKVLSRAMWTYFKSRGFKDIKRFQWITQEGFHISVPKSKLQRGTRGLFWKHCFHFNIDILPSEDHYVSSLWFSPENSTFGERCSYWSLWPFHTSPWFVALLAVDEEFTLVVFGCWAHTIYRLNVFQYFMTMFDRYWHKNAAEHGSKPRRLQMFTSCWSCSRPSSAAFPSSPRGTWRTSPPEDIMAVRNLSE